MSASNVSKRKLDLVDVISQFAIFGGAVAVVGMNNGNAWGSILGLACQPFWFYTTWKHRQWGVFASSIIYTFGWSIGTYKYFVG